MPMKRFMLGCGLWVVGVLIHSSRNGPVRPTASTHNPRPATASVFQEFLELDLVAGGVPVAAEQVLAVRREREGLHGGVELAGDQRPAAEHVPHPDRRVVPATDEVAPVGAE